MNKRYGRFSLVPTTILVLVLLSSCGGLFSMIQPLYGSWESADATLEFKLIGFELTDLSRDYTWQGDYMDAGTRIVLSVETDKGDSGYYDVVYDYELDGDTLTLYSVADSDYQLLEGDSWTLTRAN